MDDGLPTHSADPIFIIAVSTDSLVSIGSPACSDSQFISPVKT